MSTRASMTFFVAFPRPGSAYDAARCNMCGHEELGMDKWSVCRQMVLHFSSCPNR